jgi:hypothetical protein
MEPWSMEEQRHLAQCVGNSIFLCARVTVQTAKRNRTKAPGFQYEILALQPNQYAGDTQHLKPTLMTTEL